MPDSTPQAVELTGTGSGTGTGPARSSSRTWDEIVPFLVVFVMLVFFAASAAGSKLGQIVSELKKIAEEVKALRKAVQGLELGARVVP